MRIYLVMAVWRHDKIIMNQSRDGWLRIFSWFQFKLGYSEILVKNLRVDERNKKWVLSILKSENSRYIASMRSRMAEYSRRKPTDVSH
jgi:hypothetical protein